MKYRFFLFWCNCIRTITAYLLCKSSKLWDVLEKDIGRNLYYRKPCGLGEQWTSKSCFTKLGFLCLFDDTFRNVVFYRLKGENRAKAMFPQKKDCEIQSGILAPAW